MFELDTSQLTSSHSRQSLALKGLEGSKVKPSPPANTCVKAIKTMIRTKMWTPYREDNLHHGGRLRENDEGRGRPQQHPQQVPEARGTGDDWVLGKGPRTRHEGTSRVAGWAWCIGRFSEAGLHEWMPFVVFRARSRERSQRHFRADFWVGAASRWPKDREFVEIKKSVLCRPIARVTSYCLLPDTFWLRTSKNAFKVGSVKFGNSLWRKDAP